MDGGRQRARCFDVLKRIVTWLPADDGESIGLNGPQAKTAMREGPCAQVSRGCRCHAGALFGPGGILCCFECERRRGEQVWVAVSCRVPGPSALPWLSRWDKKRKRRPRFGAFCIPQTISASLLAQAGTSRFAPATRPPQTSSLGVALTTPSPLSPSHHISTPPSPSLLPSVPLRCNMGLPVWRAPSPEARDALKADPTAPARSPIRRRRPTRSPTSPRLFVHHSAVEDAIRRFREPATRPRLPPPPVPEPRNYSRRGEASRFTPGPPADDESSARSYFQLSTDAPRGLSFEDRRPLPALTPNFAPAAASRSARHDSPYSARSRSALRTRSPYLRTGDWAHLRASQGSEPRGTNAPRRSGTTERNEDGDDDNSDSNAVGFPPLRRMGRRNIADGPLPSSSLRESWSPATTVDGLGDRERSISPVVDDHWEAMLSSVAPDPLAPTAESSFASAAASASFSNSHPSSRAGSDNSNSASSSRTHLTVPSRRHSFTFDEFLRVCDTSEDDSASDTEADDEDMDPESIALRRRSAVRTSFHDPPTRNSHTLSRELLDRSRESTSYVRSFYGEVTVSDLDPELNRRSNDQLDGVAEERGTLVEDLPLDQELRDARALLERLTRRDDISDEFWASVGLRRPLADRIERIQQRERL